MRKPAANPSDADHDPGEWRGWPMMAALCLWLGAFWFGFPVVWHRWLLAWLVIPSLLLLPRAALPCGAARRWLATAAVLLFWQTLTRLWSGGHNEPPGWWFDALLVAGLLCVLLAAARARSLIGVVLPVLSLVSAAAAVSSLVAFYWPAGRNPADDRLRNVWFYEFGLNAVATGFLFAFGALVAAWLMTCTCRRETRHLHAAATSVSLLGLLATQSRGPMLMFAIGLLCLLAFERKRARPVLIAVIGTTLVYSGALLLAAGGREAALDLVGRGSTGRFAIYQQFLGRMSGRDFLIGTGIARPPVLAEDVLGWDVPHPHSIYLTQFYQTGVIGAGLLVFLIAWAGRAALALARRGDPLWLCLLAGAGVALIFDGGPVLSLYSSGGTGILLIAVPAAIAIGRRQGGSSAQ